MSMGKPNNIMSSVLHLISTKILSTGCLPTNVLKLFPETLAGSTTGLSGFETSDGGQLLDFYGMVRREKITVHDF